MALNFMKSKFPIQFQWRIRFLPSPLPQFPMIRKEHDSILDKGKEFSSSPKRSDIPLNEQRSPFRKG